jgi:hypothetical protein
MPSMQWALHTPQATKSAELRALLEQVRDRYVQTNSDDPMPEQRRSDGQTIPAYRGGTIPKSHPSYAEVVSQMQAGIEAACIQASTMKGFVHVSISGHVEPGHRGAGGQPDGIDRRLTVCVDQCIQLVPAE